jgi:hypothetical protein
MTVQEACGLAEVGNVAPLRVVPDDEQAAARAADRDVEEVGRPGCPVTGLLSRARVGAQHEHDDVGLLPLHAVHGPDVAGGPFFGFELTEGQATALRDRVAEGHASHCHAATTSAPGQVAADAGQVVVAGQRGLGGQPLTICRPRSGLQHPFGHVEGAGVGEDLVVVGFAAVPVVGDLGFAVCDVGDRARLAFEDDIGPD